MKRAPLTAAWFALAALVSLAGMVIWNDAVFNISWGMRLVVVISGISILFILPSTYFEIMRRGKTPPWIDAAFVPLLSVLIFSLFVGYEEIGLLFHPTFWMFIGIPSIIFSLLLNRWMIRRDFSCLFATGISVFLTFITMLILIPAV